MSSARLPEYGGSTPLVAAPGPAPAPDYTPAGLFPASATMTPHTAHLLPCAGCGALNGRSALTCWSCEAELVALAPFAQPAPRRPAEPPAEPAPVATAVAAEAVEGRRGLHLVSRGDSPATIQAPPSTPPPADMLDLPVLTARVEVQAPYQTPAPAARALKTRRPDRPMIALVLVAVALLAGAASLRWFAPPPMPVPLARPLPAPAAPRDEAGLERPFAAPAAGDASDDSNLSFPPSEVAPGPVAPARPARATPRSRPEPPPRAVSAAPRPAPKPREIRETISPPPAACTSNMAALGFCTLPPASAKE